MTTETIDREAGDSGKGFRLQLIRAIKLMLDTIKQNTNAVFFTAVENLEDVSHQVIDGGEVNNYFEEDKNYDLSGNFTIFSPPVINTLVSFFDIYLGQFRSSSNVKLGFYTTRNIGKERKTKLDNDKEVTLPEEPILKLIQSPDEARDDVINLVHEILVEEYKKQYEKIDKTGNLDTLIELTNSKFRDFLKAIIWHFGQENEQELKSTVLKEIEASPLYNNMHIGKENTIFCLLMDKLSEKQNSDDLIDKLLHTADVKFIFKEAESHLQDESIDPTWRYISELESKITDKRNLKEKIVSIIKDFPQKKIATFDRKAGSSKWEEREADKSFLSLKYRVFDACDAYLSSDNYDIPCNSSELEVIIRKLISEAVNDISKLKLDYRYTISNEKTIEDIIWNLFDGCFIAFDEYEHE